MNDKRPPIQTILAIIVALLCLASGCSLGGVKPASISTSLTISENFSTLQFSNKIEFSDKISR